MGRFITISHSNTAKYLCHYGNLFNFILKNNLTYCWMGSYLASQWLLFIQRAPWYKHKMVHSFISPKCCLLSLSWFYNISAISKSLQVFGKFLTVYFLFGKVLSLLWQICDIIGLIFNKLQMAKSWKIIWSHWQTLVREFVTMNI